MRRAVVIVGLVFLPGATLAAQWTGMPAWNDPAGGTGVVIAADWGMPNDAAGNGDAYGARASLGLGSMTLTAGGGSYKPSGYTDATTTWGGQVAFRLIGGSLTPIAVNLQLGAGTSSSITSGTGTYPQITTIVGAVGIAVPLPTPGIHLEGFFSPGMRHRELTERGGGLPDFSETKFGYTVGGNIGFGLFGVHVAYDHQDTSSGSIGTFGLGMHLAFRPSLGL
ncbi:MAG TPA: hypothetical protein VLV16_05150 [Gemmatimonadales bacterium]|nr:hypothetical protein [Gemmatimonadales bacterium]